MLGIMDHLAPIRRHSTTSIMSSEVKTAFANKDKEKQKQSKSAWGKVRFI